MTKIYENDAELFELMRTRLFTAVVGDIMDQMNLRRQFLPAGIAPLQQRTKMAGRAMTVLEADVFDDDPADARGPLSHKPFGLMLDALDDLKTGEVYVATGASLRYALWGELMSTRAQYRGVYAQDQGPRGKVIDYRTTIEMGGVRIAPGALMFGDREGVLVIPKEAEEEVIVRALEKVETENEVEVAIRNGMSAQQALDTFGVM